MGRNTLSLNPSQVSLGNGESTVTLKLADVRKAFESFKRPQREAGSTHQTSAKSGIYAQATKLAKSAHTALPVKLKVFSSATKGFSVVAKMGSLGAGALGAKNVSITLNVIGQTFSAISHVSTSLNRNLPRSGDTFEQSANKFNNFASEFTKAYNTTQKSFSNS
jgi:hypothetical protein